MQVLPTVEAKSVSTVLELQHATHLPRNSSKEKQAWIWESDLGFSPPYAAN